MTSPWGERVDASFPRVAFFLNPVLQKGKILRGMAGFFSFTCFFGYGVGGGCREQSVWYAFLRSMVFDVL